MSLADRVAHWHAPLAVENLASGEVSILSGAADCAELVARCSLRYVLSDDLTRLCGELAYSRGARTLACADLLHVPAELLWVEWCNDPWQDCLARYGIGVARDQGLGRRGVLIRASADGRRGVLRSLWSDSAESGVLASSAEAYFDLDTSEGQEPQPPDGSGAPAIGVFDHACRDDDVLARCFRFRYEPSWAEYYARGRLAPDLSDAVGAHVLGTIALAIPLLLTFLLLLASRSGLPQHARDFTRLNRARVKSRKAPLLDHIEVRAPLLPEYAGYAHYEGGSTRRGPRLHHVRGHLMRCGSQLVWRVPHLRGRARSGAVPPRIVTWTYDGRRGGHDPAAVALSRLPSLAKRAAP